MLVKHLESEAQKNNIVRLNGPWMPPMPESIVLNELLEKQDYGWNGKEWVSCKEWICPIIGFVDDPEKQTQYPLKVDLGKEGHLLVYGSPGYGKTTNCFRHWLHRWPFHIHLKKSIYTLWTLEAEL